MKQCFYIVDLIRNIYYSSCSNEDSGNINCSVLVENIPYSNQKDDFFNNICLDSTNSMSTICDINCSVLVENNQKDEFFNNICLDSTNNMITICDIDCSVLVENILYNNQKDEFFLSHLDFTNNICLDSTNSMSTICDSVYGKDEFFLLHLGFTNNICLDSTNSMSTICDSVYEINNRFLEYKKQFYDFLKQSYTIHTDAFMCINDNVETSICFSPQRVDEYVYDLLDYIEQHNKQMATIYKILYLMLYMPECLAYGSCRTLLDIIGFYDHVYTNLMQSPYCDNAISGVKDLLVGIAILPETIQPTITKDQYLQSLEALLTNTPSGITITFGNVSNQLIEFLATLFATNPRAYIYYTTSFDIEDDRLTTFANELSNNLSTYLNESHPLYRDLLVVLLSTNLA